MPCLKSRLRFRARLAHRNAYAGFRMRNPAFFRRVLPSTSDGPGGDGVSVAGLGAKRPTLHPIIWRAAPLYCFWPPCAAARRSCGATITQSFG